MRRTLSLLVAAAALPAVLDAQTADDSRRCELLSRRGQVDSTAAAHARAAVANERQPALAAFYRGCLAAGIEGAASAAAHFERAVKLNEASGAAHDWLARAYGDRAQNANALVQARLAPKIKRHFERAIALDPSNLQARAYLVQFYLQAPGVMGGSKEKAWRQIEEIRRLNAYRGGIIAAETRLDARDRAGGLKEWEALASQYPDSIGPVSWVAMMHVQDGRHDDAFAAVERYRARHPESRAGLFVLGRTAALAAQRLDEGAAALERYLTLGPPAPGEPSLAAAHFRLGNIHERRGDRVKARESYETAVRLDPKLADASRALAALR